MRIAYLSYARIPSRAANSVQSAKMCGAFASGGHEVTLYAREGEGSGDAIFQRYGVPRGAFRVSTFPERGVRGTRTLAFLWDLHRDLRRHPEPDLYFARDILLLASVARQGKPLIFESHRPAPTRGGRGDWMFRRLVSRPNFVRLVAVTEKMAQGYQEQYPGLARNRIQVSPGGADELPQTDGSGEWNGRTGALQVGYVGHLYEGRGVEIIVAAAAELPDCDFHLVGGMPADIERWQRQAASPNLHFHGYVPHSELGWYYRRFDVLVAPYGSKVYTHAGVETSDVMSPLKIFEYRAAARPIVCSDLPVVREVLEDGVNALLVPPEDPGAFAAALRRLRDEPETASAIAAKARRQFELDHTWEQRARSLLEGL
jgi:glycosyltransferase involved in cell wall biosynthesis